MSKAVEKIEEVLISTSEKYSNLSWVRALVSALPYVGGSIDILITSQHDKIVKKRLETLIREIKQKIEQLDETKINKGFLESELAHDMLFVSFEKASKIRDNERLKGIAEILVKAIRNDIEIQISPIDAITVLGELTENESFFLAKVYEIYTERTELLTGSENSLFTIESVLKIIPPKLFTEASVILGRLEGKGLISSLFEYYKLTFYAKELVETVDLKYQKDSPNSGFAPAGGDE